MEAGQTVNTATKNVNGGGKTQSDPLALGRDSLTGLVREATDKVSEISHKVAAVARNEFSDLSDAGSKVLSEGEKYFAEGAELVKKRPILSVASAAMLGAVVGFSLSKLIGRAS